MKSIAHVLSFSLLPLLLFLYSGAGGAQTPAGRENPKASIRNAGATGPAGKKSPPLKIGELMKKQKQEVVFRASWGSGQDQLGCVIPQEAMPEGPMSFAIDTEGNFFILDQLNKRVQVFNKNGKYQKPIPLPNIYISDIDMGPSGNLLLLDVYDTKSVLLVDKKGSVLKKTGLKGKGIAAPGQATELYSREDGVWVASDNLYVKICDASGDEVKNRMIAQYLPSSDGNHLLKARKIGDITVLVTWRLAGDFSKLYKYHLYTEIPVMHFTLVDTDKKGNIYIGLYLWDEDTKAPDYNIDNLYEMVAISDGKGKEKQRIYMPVSSKVLSPTRTVRVTPEGTIYQLVLGDSEAVMWKYAP